MRGRIAIGVILLCAPVAAAPITGRVIDKRSGSPVKGAEIKIGKPGAALLLADIETDSTGHFTGPDVPDGDYTVEASKLNFIATRIRVHALNGAVAPLEISLARFGVISGQIRDERGAPVPGAQVVVLLGENRTTTGNEIKADSLGRYRIHRLTPGTYRVAATFNGPARADVMLHPNNAEPRVFAVREGEAFTDIDFTLTSPLRYRIRGTVESSAPKAIFGLSLIARDRPFYAIAQLRSDPGGSFQFEGIPPGSYDIVAAGPSNSYGYRRAGVEKGGGYGRVRLDVTGADIESLNIPIAPGRSAAVRLEARAPACNAGELRLTALDDSGLWPYEALKTTAGKTETFAGLAPGRYALEFADPFNQCYQTAPVTVDVAGGDVTTPAAVLVDRAGSIAGKLTGKQDGGIVVALTELNRIDAEVTVVTPSSDGAFSFSGLRPGRYRVGARHGRQESISEVEVAAGNATQIELAVPTAGLQP